MTSRRSRSGLTLESESPVLNMADIIVRFAIVVKGMALVELCSLRREAQNFYNPYEVGSPPNSELISPCLAIEA